MNLQTLTISNPLGSALCSLKQTSEENVIKLSGGVTLLWSICGRKEAAKFPERNKIPPLTYGKIFVTTLVCGLVEISYSQATNQSQSL